ncbi:MAG: response regulator [Acidimicrobiales bacterium]
MTIRVFLVDDHPIVRRGLRELIEAEDDLTVVGEAGSAEEALRLVPGADPDVAVLDVCLPPGADGIQLCRELRARHEDLVALMLTSLDGDEALMDALLAGAAGYVPKQLGESNIVDAIRRVAAHETLFPPGLTERLVERARPAKDDDERMGRLTEQEHRILELIAEGLTNRQIAGRLFLAEKTVKNYVSNMLSKLGMQGRTEAAVYATRRAQRRLVPDDGGPRPRLY